MNSIRGQNIGCVRAAAPAGGTAMQELLCWHWRSGDWTPEKDTTQDVHSGRMRCKSCSCKRALVPCSSCVGNDGREIEAWSGAQMRGCMAAGRGVEAAISQARTTVEDSYRLEIASLALFATLPDPLFVCADMVSARSAQQSCALIVIQLH
eukprot:760009-Pelagomonas_calceolata.AAC.2